MGKVKDQVELAKLDRINQKFKLAKNNLGEDIVINYVARSIINYSDELLLPLKEFEIFVMNVDLLKLHPIPSDYILYTNDIFCLIKSVVPLMTEKEKIKLHNVVKLIVANCAEYLMWFEYIIIYFNI